MRTSFKLFSVFVLSCILYSCQKVVNINLNAASPTLVVQANISNQPGPYSVVLTQSVGFTTPNTFPAVTGARVIIEDNVGNADTLKESPAGTYTGSKLTGTPNRTYTLLINANGNNYTSVCTMPAPVNIDSISLKYIPLNGSNSVFISFKDPATGNNYYNGVEIVNRVVKNQDWTLSDVGFGVNGHEITGPISSGGYQLKSGDTATILLECIDVGMYNYYNSLYNASGSSGIGPGNPTPANPPSNISNGALGYFNACAITSRSIIIP